MSSNSTQTTHNTTPPVDGDDSGDDAYVALLTMHQEAIHAFLNSLLPGDSGVEDVLQQTNVVLWKKRDNFESGSNFKAWAFSIARWETRAWLTSRKRQDWLVFDDELTDQLIDQFQELPDEAGDSGIIRALRLCMAKLNDKQRLLVFSYYQHEKSITECADIVKKSENALRVSLFRIRSSLRNCIESRVSTREIEA